MNTASEVFLPGARIEHPELGCGVVRRLRRDGRALLVNFDGQPNLLLEVRAVEVHSPKAAVAAHVDAAVLPDQPQPALPTASVAYEVPPAPAAPPETKPAPRPSTPTPDNLRAAQTIEALRLGVVPPGDLRPASVGRDREIRLVRRDLDQVQESGSARVFLGDYGTGKTHMLELVEQEALARRFLVGRATLDAQYVQPNQPMRVYRSIVSALRYPDGGGSGSTGLEPLLAKACADPQWMKDFADGKSLFQQHLYLRPALHYYQRLLELDDPVPRDLLLDWISGQRPEGNEELDTQLRRVGRAGPPIYALKDFQPWAHVYAFLLGGIAALACSLGYSGLVLLVDEAENYDLLGSQARAFADSLFRCMVFAAMGPERAPFAEDTIDKGGFPPQKRLPLVFQWPQHLYFVSAMTPSTGGEALLRSLLAPEQFTELSALSPTDYQEMGQRITRLFEAAHPEMQLPSSINRPLGEVLWSLIERQHLSTPREASKLTVEFLDLIRLRPEGLTRFFADVERALAS